MIKTILLTKYATWKFGCTEGSIIELNGIPRKVKVKKNSSPYGVFRTDPNLAHYTPKKGKE